MKPLIESSGKRGLRVNNKRKNFRNKPPIEHEAGTIRDKTHPSKSGGLKKSKLKKLQEKNARQAENSSARITLKKEIPILEQEANEAAFEDLTEKLGHHEYFAEELFDDTNFSIGHSKLIDSPSYVARMKEEVDRAKDYSSSAKEAKPEPKPERIYITGCGFFGKYDTVVSG